jgi:hypothetical protein
MAFCYNLSFLDVDEKMNSEFLPPYSILSLYLSLSQGRKEGSYLLQFPFLSHYLKKRKRYS